MATSKIKLQAKKPTIQMANGTLVSNSSVAGNGFVTGTICASITASQYAWLNFFVFSDPPSESSTFKCFANNNGDWVGMVQFESGGMVKIYPTTALSNRSVTFTFSYATI